MKIILNRASFIAYLNQIKNISERCVLKVNDKKITGVLADASNTIICFSSFDNVQTDSDDIISLNIPDIRKLTRILECISEEDITLDVTSSTIKYKGTQAKFNYNMLEDGLIAIPKGSVDIIKNLKFTTHFPLLHQYISALSKGSTFVGDVQKIYISTEGTSVHGELASTDQQHADKFQCEISTSFTGLPIDTPVPLNYEVFKSISFSKDVTCTVSYTGSGIFLFNIQSSTYSIKYLLSAYAK